MKKDISDLVAETTEIDHKHFLHLVDQAANLLSAEKASFGELEIEGRLVRLPPSGEATVVGDIHGDLDSLKHVLTDAKFVEKASKGKTAYLVFLGDYGGFYLFFNILM